MTNICVKDDSVSMACKKVSPVQGYVYSFSGYFADKQIKVKPMHPNCNAPDIG